MEIFGKLNRTFDSISIRIARFAVDFDLRPPVTYQGQLMSNVQEENSDWLSVVTDPPMQVIE